MDIGDTRLREESGGIRGSAMAQPPKPAGGVQDDNCRIDAAAWTGAEATRTSQACPKGCSDAQIWAYPPVPTTAHLLVEWSPNRKPHKLQLLAMGLVKKRTDGDGQRARK